MVRYLTTGSIFLFLALLVQKPIFALVVAPLFAISAIKVTVALIGFLSVPIATLVGLFNKQKLGYRLLMIVFILSLAFIGIYSFINLVAGKSVEISPSVINTQEKVILLNEKPITSGQRIVTKNTSTYKISTLFIVYLIISVVPISIVFNIQKNTEKVLKNLFGILLSSITTATILTVLTWIYLNN